MLSSTTIEAVDQVVRPRAPSPPSDMRFSDRPKRYMMMNVASTETGIESATMMRGAELAQEREQHQHREQAAEPARRSVTSRIAPSMKLRLVGDRDELHLATGAAGGRMRCLTARATATVFASPSL